MTSHGKTAGPSPEIHLFKGGEIGLPRREIRVALETIFENPLETLGVDLERPDILFYILSSGGTKVASFLIFAVKQRFIEYVGTLPNYRNRGHQNMLFSRVLSEWGFASLSLEVEQTNTKALDLYRKYGFVIEREEICKLFGSPIYIMSRPKRISTPCFNKHLESRQNSLETQHIRLLNPCFSS